MELHHFIEIVADELQLPPAQVLPGARLESLGVESIDVVQIVQRVEATTGRALDRLDISAVESVADLYGALVTGERTGENQGSEPKMAGPSSVAAHVAEVQRFLGTDPLADCQTLIDVIERRAALTPNAEAFRFTEKPCSFAELALVVQHTARVLRELGVGAGDRVVLVSPNCAEFFALFYGVQHLRAAPVPVFHRSGGARIAAIARHCQAGVIVTAEPLETARYTKIRADLPDIRVVDARTLLARQVPDSDRSLPTPRADDLAMLQYTSGTTGDSKGVMLTHRALVANIRQIIPPTEFRSSDVIVTWLPVYHDMGLIAMTMCPLYVGARVVLLPVSLKPRAWLEAITRHRGTVTAAPDFAYRYALRFAGEASQYDLKSLRFALIAAEPVRAATIHAFEALHGLRDVLRPGYGLAEVCVGVSIWPMGHPGLAVDPHGVVGVGRPLPDMELTIREGDRVLSPGEVGEICVRSPSQTLGYYRDPQRTAALHTTDGYIRTGDRGYVDENGVMYVVGRLKDIVIVGGRNFSPREFEEVAERCDGVLGAMAVGIDRGGDAGEQVHLIVEAKTPRTQAEKVRQEVARALRSELGLRPERIEVVRRGVIPRTYNGKLRYEVMRQQLQAAANDPPTHS